MNTIEYFINLVVFEFIHLVGISIFVMAPIIFINDNVVSIPKIIAGLGVIVVLLAPLIFAHLSAKARVYDGLTFVDAFMFPIRLIKLKFEQILERFR